MIHIFLPESQVLASDQSSLCKRGEELGKFLLCFLFAG